MKTKGGLMFYHFDGMSSVSELTDRHGDVIQHYRHDAFGGLFTGITAPYNTNSYTGHQYDQDVGLIDMRARWYDASIGRFLQEDTYPGTLDNPLSQNRYAYVMNNPMNFWDPTGRIPQEVLDGEEVYYERRESPSFWDSWRYTLQHYESETSDRFNFETTESEDKRSVSFTWQIMVSESWLYLADHQARLDYDDNLMPFEPEPSEYHRWSRDYFENHGYTVSAEDMMERNYERLLREGWLPDTQTKLFSYAITYHNGELLSHGILDSGVFRYNDMLNRLIWGKSSNSTEARIEAYVGVHEVMLGFYHASILIFVEKDSKFMKLEDFQVYSDVEREMNYITLGAGPDFSSLSRGIYRSGINRPEDVRLDNKVEMIPIEINEDIIQELIDAQIYFEENKGLLPSYVLFPSIFSPGGYNSNSFVSGILKAIGYDDIPNPSYRSPGWSKPIPEEYFRVPE